MFFAVGFKANSSADFKCHHYLLVADLSLEFKVATAEQQLCSFAGRLDPRQTMQQHL
jgi:hypothetical protein